MTDHRLFVARLVAIRLSRNLPQRTIAARMGVCRSAISRFENDPARDPHLSTVLRYAEALGVGVGVVGVHTKNTEQQVKSTPPRPMEEQQ